MNGVIYTVVNQKRAYLSKIKNQMVRISTNWMVKSKAHSDFNQGASKVQKFMLKKFQIDDYFAFTVLFKCWSETFHIQQNLKTISNEFQNDEKKARRILNMNHMLIIVFFSYVINNAYFKFYKKTLNPWFIGIFPSTSNKMLPNPDFRCNKRPLDAIK